MSLSLALLGCSTAPGLAQAGRSEPAIRDWSGFYAGASLGGGTGTNSLSPRKSPVQQSTTTVTIPGASSCSRQPNNPTIVLTPEQEAGLRQGIVTPSLFTAIGYIPATSVGNLTSYSTSNNSLYNLVFSNGTCSSIFDVSSNGNGPVQYNNSGAQGTYVQGPGTTTTIVATALTGPLANAQGIDAATLAAVTALPGQKRDIRTSGIFGGGQIGYNHQIGSILVGVEADLNGSAIAGRYRVGGFTARSDVDWFGTVRGRVGYAWDRFLVYATGGFAYGDVSLAYALGGLSVGETRLQTGWTAGSGIEFTLTPQVSMKAEYKHVVLGPDTFLRRAGYDARLRAEIDTGLIGLNYRW
ncbi:outer membrane protein [uncultured Methylobacterium sp.]|uniref:outer membrane protein n=1 Tax=uncultured Methylobacterium sp. TaxID=157278 RepID=UPI0035CB753F